MCTLQQIATTYNNNIIQYNNFNAILSDIFRYKFNNINLSYAAFQYSIHKIRVYDAQRYIIIILLYTYFTHLQRLVDVFLCFTNFHVIIVIEKKTKIILNIILRSLIKYYRDTNIILYIVIWY